MPQKVNLNTAQLISTLIICSPAGVLNKKTNTKSSKVESRTRINQCAAKGRVNF